MSLMIKVISGPLNGHRFTIADFTTILVGRSHSAQIRLPSDDTLVSKQHFQIEYGPDHCRLTDLNSRNGVTVNGNKILRCDLSSGDFIAFGKHGFLLTFSHCGNMAGNNTVKIISASPPYLSKVQTDTPSESALTEYRLLREIGEGAVAKVFEGIRVCDSQHVAIKILHPHIARSSVAFERFARELHIMEKIRHANILSILGVGEWSNRPFTITELATGSDLKQDLMISGRPTIYCAVARICQALEGVCAAHWHGVVHRDLKPGNLLIFDQNHTETIKVADFGHASLRDESLQKELTEIGEVDGTPEFMAPEQVLDFKNVTEAADQYAIAATLYYLLTGEFVFDFPLDTGDKIVTLLHDKPILIQERNPAVSDELARIIHRALARNPLERFPSARDFKRRLHHWLESQTNENQP